MLNLRAVSKIFLLSSLLALLNPGLPRPCQAGGTVDLIKVLDFKQQNAISTLKMQKLASNSATVCPHFSLNVSYAAVPWYASLPGGKWLSGSHHPSFAETQTALNYLKKAQLSGTRVHFGQISGLEPTYQPCVFNSKGLRLEAFEQGQAVFSYFYPL